MGWLPVDEDQKRVIIPSVIPSIQETLKAILDAGFKYSDVIVLIQRRTKPKLGMGVIKKTLNAIMQLEQDLMKGNRYEIKEKEQEDPEHHEDDGRESGVEEKQEVESDE
jgi:hypothetical protein